MVVQFKLLKLLSRLFLILLEDFNKSIIANQVALKQWVVRRFGKFRKYTKTLGMF